ncbi:MAG TPA: hypothetical protein VN442_19680, partial [Bryobacteraceae bacterium]|nr:hypothetical protein [Bryobacteraceae bacterium]
LYAVNRAGDETLCNCWAGGASYGELIIAENRQADPSVVGAGLTVTSDGGIKLGTTNIANALMNPGFEDSLVHWETFGTGPTPVIESSGAYTGSKCLKMDSTSGAVYVQQGPISCRPGDLWYTEAYVKGAAILALVIDFYSASGWLDQSATVITPSGTWSPVQLAAKAAPTGTSSIRVLVLVYAGGGVAYLDNVYLSKVKNAEEINFNGTELRINPTTHALEIKGVDLSKSIAASVGAALAVSSGVLGVAPSGITESLVAQYAIANTHLKRVGVDKIAIVDADIVNLAAAKITAGTFAAGVAYVGDLSANQMKTGTLAANIAVLGAVAVSQLTAGTINASITMTAPTIISTVGSDTASLANGLIESTSASYRAKIQSGQLTLSAIAGGQPLAQHQNAYSGWMDGFGFTVVSCSSSTGVRVNGPAGANRISLTADAANFTSCPIRINGVDAINANGQFVGAGVNCPSYGVAAAGFNPNVGGLQYYGRSGTFYDRDGNAMVFRNGVLTTA